MRIPPIPSRKSLISVPQRVGNKFMESVDPTWGMPAENKRWLEDKKPFAKDPALLAWQLSTHSRRPPQVVPVRKLAPRVASTVAMLRNSGDHRAASALMDIWAEQMRVDPNFQATWGQWWDHARSSGR